MTDSYFGRGCDARDRCVWVRISGATGRILRDFEYAISGGDGATALACIDELRAFGRLDARNLQFLEGRWLAALNQWRELRDLPELDSLLAIRRPLRVTEAIIACVYNTELEPFEREGNVDGALRHFRDEVRPRFGDLYRSRRGLTGEQVAASFILAAATDDPPRPDAVSAIIDGSGGTATRRQWLEAIDRVTRQLPGARAVERGAATTSVAGAQTAFALGDVDRAIELCESLPPSLETASLLLRCAHEVRTIELARIAVDVVDQLSLYEQDALQNSQRLWRVYGELVHLLGISEDSDAASKEAIIDSWMDWFRRLTSAVAWPSAVAAAE